jgi:hypothetical protein
MSSPCDGAERTELRYHPKELVRNRASAFVGHITGTVRTNALTMIPVSSLAFPLTRKGSQ